jgi:hypothetical protein
VSELQLPADYVDAAVEWLRRVGFVRHPGFVPKDMVDPSIAPQDDWVGWRPVSSTVTDTDLNSIEQRAGIAFPPLYRAFLKYKHFLSLTEFGLRFIPHPSSDWRNDLTNAIFSDWEPERLVRIGLLPFGEESFMDAGPVCFDTRSRLPDGDCPVVFWDHQWVGTEREIQPMFSSGRKMFECLKVVANSDILFGFAGEPNGGVSNTAAVIQRFFEIDQGGAGGIAKGYWSVWQ